MNPRPQGNVRVFSHGILRIPFLESLLGAEIVPSGLNRRKEFAAVAGWGKRPNTGKVIEYASRHGVPYIALEDGFLRSFGTGQNSFRLSLVIDDLGIYYDSAVPSALEALLNSAADVCNGLE